MKHYILAILILGMAATAGAQRIIRDQAIVNQQERMVFKQWDRKKFTPTSGFLGLNPNYWLTWAWHPNYPKKDLRPLGPVGPQTQRLAFAAAMQNTENAYKLHADTLRNTAITEAVNYSAIFSTADPLWMLYYRHEFEPLLNEQDANLMYGIPAKEIDYLVRSGVYDWYREESSGIKERLDGAMTTTLDRGSRLLTYHRLLLEYRRLNTAWEAKKQYARKFLALSESTNKMKSRNQPILERQGFRTDQQIADEILRKSKL